MKTIKLASNPFDNCVIVSDTHLHNWSAFSSRNSDTVNSRLQLLIDELWRVAEYGKSVGATAMVHCGDMFHVRGSVSPSVLNTTLELFKKISKQLDMRVFCIAGNHDLETRDSTWLGNAVSSLSPWCATIDKPVMFETDGERRYVFVPWFESVDGLKQTLSSISEMIGSEYRHLTTLFIHAPVDAVITGLPDHGLTASFLAELGFENVFSGHYHHHKEVADSVYSVGALAHHSWSDVGSRAGFIHLSGGSVTWHESSLPKFVEFREGMSSSVVRGNYVKLEVGTAESAEKIKDFVEELKSTYGARAVVTQVVKESTVKTEDGAERRSGYSVYTPELSVSRYIESKGFDLHDEVLKASLAVLDKVK